MRVDPEQGVQAGPEAPGPHPLAVVLMPRLVNIEYPFSRQRFEQLLVGIVQRRADFIDDLSQLATRDGHLDHVAKELADRGEGGVAEALQVGDQSGQARTDQTANGYVLRQNRFIGSFAVDAPVFGASVLLDRHLRRHEIDLLDDQSDSTIETE